LLSGIVVNLVNVPGMDDDAGAFEIITTPDQTQQYPFDLLKNIQLQAAPIHHHSSIPMIDRAFPLINSKNFSVRKIVIQLNHHRQSRWLIR
jgi:hypothetical protein